MHGNVLAIRGQLHILGQMHNVLLLGLILDQRHLAFIDCADNALQGRAENVLRVQLRSYTRTAEKLSLLPAAQAAAIIPAGTVLALSYADTAAQPLQAGWRS